MHEATHGPGPSAGESKLGRVLVIDDEPLICEVIRLMLEDRYEVVTAGSGAEAQALIEDDQGFDVLLCDLMMRNVSGIDLHAWLQQEHPELAARMVFMTGGAFTDRSRTFLDEVANAWVPKPLEWGALDEAVQAVMRASEQG